jgi:hypothetical protein
MNADDPDLPVEPELDRRLRRALSRVALTVDDTAAAPPARPVASLSPATAAAPGRRRRRAAVAIGLTLAALPLIGFAYAKLGSEHVTEPAIQRLREQALAHGGAGPNRYWLVPSFHDDACGQPMPGVELIVESENPVGGEWNSGGVGYGEQALPATTGLPGQTPGCPGYDEGAWLKDPSRFALIVSRPGRPDVAQHGGRGRGDWFLVAAVHPRVRALRITTPGGPNQTVSTVPRPERPRGPRYAVAVLPAKTTTTQITLLDGHGSPLPGGTSTRRLGR